MADATVTGQRVLQALDEGRQEAIRIAQKRGRYIAGLVLDFAANDMDSGKPARGRAKRIALSLGGIVSEGHVRRILRTLSCVHDSGMYSANTNSSPEEKNR